MIKTIFSRPGEHYYGPEYKLFLISFPTAVPWPASFLFSNTKLFQEFQ